MKAESDKEEVDREEGGACCRQRRRHCVAKAGVSKKIVDEGHAMKWQEKTVDILIQIARVVAPKRAWERFKVDSETRGRWKYEQIAVAIPDDLDKRCNRLADSIPRASIDKFTALERLYNLTDEYSAHVAPHAPCRKGCSSCCRISVLISDIEAEYIQKKTGRKSAKVRGIRVPPDGWKPPACTFLGVDNACTIYEFRPYVCRRHNVLEVDASRCDLNDPHDDIPWFRSGPTVRAYRAIGKRWSIVQADIRDHFPPE